MVAAGVIEKLGVALLTGPRVRNVGGNKGFERARGGFVGAVGRTQHRLTHVADVERPASARVQRCSSRMPGGYWTGIS